MEVDRAFSQASKAIGRSAAFLQYMSEEAVLYPFQGEAIRGREEYRRIIESASPGAEVPHWSGSLFLPTSLPVVIWVTPSAVTPQPKPRRTAEWM
jgi:hypothetical protein